MDRNTSLRSINSMILMSLSARRAWIEICYLDNIEITEAVALRKESVDRNNINFRKRTGKVSRSPQGERG